MNNFIQFLSDYKDVLIGGLTLIFTIIILFIKRRPKTLDDFVSIVDEVCAYQLPKLISSVESPGNGLAKKKSVRNMALTSVCKNLGRHLSDKEKVIALKTIDDSIEAILSTPQKKL